MRKESFTFIELAIVMLVLSVIMGVLFQIFSVYMKMSSIAIVRTKAQDSLIRVAVILDSDIKKAGYGVDNSTDALMWNSTSRTLVIRYVDFTKAGCENETFGNNSCSYLIEYYPKNQNLYRLVDELDTSDNNSAPLFYDGIVKVDDFNVDIDAGNRTVTYFIKYHLAQFPEIRGILSNTLEVYNLK